VKIKYNAILKTYLPQLPFVVKALSRFLTVFCFLLVAVAAGWAATLWQNTDATTIVTNNSISCNLAGEHADTSYWRAFTPITYGYTGIFSVTGVRIGIEEAVAGSGGSQPFTVRIYTNTGGAFPAGTRTLIGTTNTTAANGALFFQDINVTAPANTVGTEIVVEVFTPNGQSVHNRFFIGSNNLGQSAPSYISAADCSAPNPTTVASAGAPNMHTLIALVGTGATDANTSISGRVLTAGGNGIRNASVSITLPTGEVRSVTTGSLGYYTFADLPAGQTYILTVSAKRYRFLNPTTVIALDDELTGEDFVALGE
jgi:Carboxypeptidase regulatory-like domain